MDDLGCLFALVAAVVRQAALDYVERTPYSEHEHSPSLFLAAAGLEAEAPAIVARINGPRTHEPRLVAEGRKLPSRAAGDWSRSCACGRGFDHPGRYSAHARGCAVYRANKAA